MLCGWPPHIALLQIDLSGKGRSHNTPVYPMQVLSCSALAAPTAAAQLGAGIGGASRRALLEMSRAISVLLITMCAAQFITHRMLCPWHYACGNGVDVCHGVVLYLRGPSSVQNPSFRSSPQAPMIRELVRRAPYPVLCSSAIARACKLSSNWMDIPACRS